MLSMNWREHEDIHATDVLDFAKKHNISIQDAAAALRVELETKKQIDFRKFAEYICLGGLDINLAMQPDQHVMISMDALDVNVNADDHLYACVYTDEGSPISIKQE